MACYLFSHFSSIFDQNADTGSILKNYYHILELPTGASLDDIKRSYRSLVKRYHPDLNKEPDASRKFMEVHEAYEFLMNPGRRMSYDSTMNRNPASEEEQRRRERFYDVWVKYQQDIARVRAQKYAQSDFESFRKSKYYKATMAANKALNVTFLSFCFVIIAIPMWQYAKQIDLPEHQQRPFIIFLIPAIAGLIFAGWGYYYWFVMKVEEFD